MEFVRPTRNENVRTLAGVCLILVALALPGISIKSGGGWGPSGVEVGWWCARQANLMLLLLPRTFLHPRPGSGVIFLFGLTGLINPLLMFSLIPNRYWQFLCASVIVACLAATWLAIWVSSLTPLPGHFLWVAGVLLIVSREWFGEPWASWRAGRNVG
ncbi:hypothetical protein AciX9_3020 [Granulicella tundricola MP5ACTX9]|uniref:Uncharacterized protein n=1 Tax=Granulicella tundricola (strain ATCC BAA-1859 / DSM 23138 / MP5ACTX9) TaxID=1198114 RepID=E8X060_GRATM|nr:hypothetical protein AciX9_3020 [Granulicella tundricola MP5ACTX9]